MGTPHNHTFATLPPRPIGYDLAPAHLANPVLRSHNPGLQRLQPVLQNLSEREKKLSEEMWRIREKLETEKMAYPPIHYLELERMEQELTKKEKKIETLKRTHVRFSGTLFIRIPGET